MGAPVCLINAPLPSAEPQTPTLPAIPVATNLASAIQAVNILSQIVQAMTNQSAAQSAGFSGGFTGPKKKPAKNNSNFQELTAKRTTTTTKIYDPKDNTVYVEVKQITGLTFVNKVTGQEITWAQ